MQLQLGLDAIRSYKRLAYTPWHALAEFVDNSTQSYFNNRSALDAVFKRSEDRLTVSITYDRNDDLLRIADNAMGMNLAELEHAMHIAKPPANTDGRSKYGMGMKTAACWFGNRWSVRTKRLGDTTEYSVEVDVERIADGENALNVVPIEGKDADLHYTVVEIRQHNRRLVGRTLGKVRDFLRSMYRKDLSDGTLVLMWQGDELSWEMPESDFMRSKDGATYRREFQFDVQGKHVSGWVGVLAFGRAGRDKAGFSILQAGRVIRGWPLSWRPEKIFGQIEGSNDLVNQRLMGEINLDGFQVTHTKDMIQWMGDEEEEVSEKLFEVASEYREVAKTARKGTEDARGPSDIDVRTAVDEFQQELSSDEMVDALQIESVPPPELVEQSFKPLLERASENEPNFSTAFGEVRVVGYLDYAASPNDPYVVADSTTPDRVLVIINMQHPHFRQLTGAEGVLNYFRHCTYDAAAEWQARRLTQRLDSATIKLLKDKLLRVPMAIEMHAGPGD